MTMNAKGNIDWKSWKQQADLSDGQLEKLWDASSNYKQDYQPDLSKGLASLQHRIGNEPVGGKVVPLKRQRSVLLRIAASLLVLAVAVLVLKNQLGTQSEMQTIASTDQATLEQRLSDGTVVELNRSSSLVFNKDFEGETRQVALKGEAFFDVARNEAKPFIIETEAVVVKVLGTSFNVRANPGDDFVEVYVASGKGRDDIKQTGEYKELTKGQYLRFEKKQSKLAEGKDDIGIPSAWHTGQLSFKEQTIPTVLAGLERLFGVSIDLETEQNPNCTHTLTVREGELNEAFKALEKSCSKLKIKQVSTGKYKVSGVCCQ